MESWQAAGSNSDYSEDRPPKPHSSTFRTVYPNRLIKAFLVLPETPSNGGYDLLYPRDKWSIHQRDIQITATTRSASTWYYSVRDFLHRPTSFSKMQYPLRLTWFTTAIRLHPPHSKRGISFMHIERLLIPSLIILVRAGKHIQRESRSPPFFWAIKACLLYTSDAADE